MKASPFPMSSPGPPAVTEPRQGAFDNPAVTSQLLAGVNAFSGSANLDPALRQDRSAARNVTGLVGVGLHGPPSELASGPSDRTDSVDQLLEDSWAGACAPVGRKARGVPRRSTAR